VLVKEYLVPALVAPPRPFEWEGGREGGREGGEGRSMVLEFQGLVVIAVCAPYQPGGKSEGGREGGRGRTRTEVRKGFDERLAEEVRRAGGREGGREGKKVIVVGDFPLQLQSGDGACIAGREGGREGERERERYVFWADLLVRFQKGLLEKGGLVDSYRFAQKEGGKEGGREGGYTNEVQNRMTKEFERKRAQFILLPKMEEGREGGREREEGRAMVARAGIVLMRELNERGKEFSKTFNLFSNTPVYASVDLGVVLP